MTPALPTDTTGAPPSLIEPADVRNRRAGAALLRIAAELRAALPPDVDPSVLDDLKLQEEVGHWLAGSQAMDGTALGIKVTGLR